jgi:hypothetical protein
LRDRRTERSLVARRLLTLLLLAGMVSLVALAYASPPDALWESGIYDDADLDDVVLDVVTLTAIPAPGVVLADYPRDALETLPVGKPRQVSLVLLDSFESRAPPLR